MRQMTFLDLCSGIERDGYFLIISEVFSDNIRSIRLTIWGFRVINVTTKKQGGQRI